MSTSVRSNTTLKKELKEMQTKPGHEYTAWYQELRPIEREFVDTRIKMSEDKQKLETEDSAKGAAESVDGGSAVEGDVPLQSNMPSEITEVEISAMWTAIDLVDVASFDQESLKIFEYQGFNPKSVLLSLMKSKKKNKVPDDVFKADVLTLCAISIIKGSINNNNIKKISEEGQQEISRLETVYGIKRGSGRKEKPEIVTVSRIGATFPGKIIQLICAGKVQSRTFIGPFSSSNLPTFMRHQAFAAVIPRSLGQKTRDFLLHLVTAFSVDQSIQINPNKKEKMDPIVVFTNQFNFVNITHGGLYPPEHTKISIFKTLNFVYEDLLPTARKIVAIMGELVIPSRDEFNSEIAALM